MSRGSLILLVAWAAGLATAGLGALAYTQTGWFDATASTPHDPVSAWLTHDTMVNSVRRSAAGIAAPASFTAAEVRAGFRDYDRDCVSCHGGPGVAHATWADGLNPPPPYLIDISRRWNSAQLYWIVAHGVKMTAMPAWRPTRSDGDIWCLVAFLKALPDLSAQDYARMRAADAGPR